MPNPNVTILPGRCPRCSNLLVRRQASDRVQCASWVCELTAATTARTED